MKPTRDGMLFQSSRIAPLLENLASDHGIYIGTMSWKYPGWCGTLYDEDRYLWGNHFSKARFNRNCLEEYAAVFKSVCVDATYYRIPGDEFLDDIASRVPGDFRFSFKVPDEITIRNFPDLPAFGKRRGRPNAHFLSNGLFVMGFLRHLEKIRDKVGMLIFEFSHFHLNDFVHGREFVTRLDEFFEQAPRDWTYGVEIRNRNLLHSDHFDMLEHHGVAHIYNQWTLMPPVTEQLRLFDPVRNPFIAARYLLSPERAHDWAVREFEPYNQVKEIDPAARESMRALLDHALFKSRRESEAIAGIANAPHSGANSYLYIGNQLEGNALHTIADVLESVVQTHPISPSDELI